MSSVLGLRASLAENSIREEVRRGLNSGRLLRATGRAWIHAALGNHRCAACGRAIRARDPECEVMDRVELHAHVSCFKIWVAESQAPGAGERPRPAVQHAARLVVTP